MKRGSVARAGTLPSRRDHCRGRIRGIRFAAPFRPVNICHSGPRWSPMERIGRRRTMRGKARSQAASEQPGAVRGGHGRRIERSSESRLKSDPKQEWYFGRAESKSSDILHFDCPDVDVREDRAMLYGRTLIWNRDGSRGGARLEYPRPLRKEEVNR